MSEFKEQAREKDEMIALQSREEIDADFAVGMVRDGLHVFIDKTDEQLTYDMVFNSKESFDFGSHIFTAPMMEVAHETFLETTSGALDRLNDDVKDIDIVSTSIEDYAKTMYNDGDSQFKWNDGHSEWENIRESILSGKTEYIRAWLYEAVPGDFQQEIDNLREALDHYAVTYFKGQEYKENKQALYSIEQGDDIRFFKAPEGYTAEDILKIAQEDKPYAKLMELGERIYDEGNYAAIQQSDEFTFSVEMNFDTDTAQLYEVNGGKGGIAESDRTDDNVRLSKIKISEYMQDKTFAYSYGSFNVVHLDIGTEERKNAVSEALKNIINNVYNGKMNGVQPYKNLLEQITPAAEFMHASQGHLSCLEYALRNAQEDKELCMSMLESIKQAENNLTPIVTIKGYECIPKETWEDHGVTFKIGQSVDDMSFYYARATGEKVTRDYEYDHKPDREKVMSDHADKLAEEDIDRGEAIYGADGYLAFPDPEMKHLVENIPQQQDISHNFNHADPTAQRGERKDTMNTKFEVTSMTMLDGDNPKAIASVAINDELIVGGITVRANQEGELYVKMPQQKNGKDEQGKDKYEDRVFPTTAEARKALDEAVLGKFEDLAAQGLENSYVKVEPPENSVSKIGVSLNKTNSEKSNVKATGQITVDNCFVIKGVTVTENVNSKTKETFQSVNLPHFKQDKNGQYPPVVKPITAEMREKVNNAVMKSFNTQTRGVKFAEVGGKENSATYFRQNNQFAEKLMEQLENKGIPYHARISDTTTLSVKATDKAAVEDIKKEIANEGRKPSLLGEVGKIKAEQKAHEAEKPAPQKAKSNNQEL